MKVHLGLGDNIEKTNIEKARAYWLKFEIDQKRFFNGEFKPEDPSLVLDR